MRLRPGNESKFTVCNSDRIGRILKSDQSGRSLIHGFRLFLLPARQTMGVRRLSVLSELHVGETGVVVALDLPESVQNHLMHMGFVPEALVTALRRAPAGDPTVYGVDGMEIALRHETADAIRVRPAALEDNAALESVAPLASELLEAVR
jgi:ferrous iron transport protein A